MPILILFRLVADLLSAAGADHVVTMDLHAGQIQVTLQTLQLWYGETICNANFLLDFKNAVIKFVKKISQLWKLLKPFAVQTLHSHSLKSLVSPL